MRLTSFQKLALWTTALTYLLILVGSLVRVSGAGLGCPDWPRCFGSWIPPASAAALPPEFDASQFNPTLMWTEYVNRLLGVTVGFSIFATAISAWRHHRHQPRILWPTIAAFVLVGYEGWLGGRVVAHELAPWIVTAHLIVAIIIVQLLLYVTFTAFETHKTRGDRALGWWVAALVVVTLVQAGFGTQVRGSIDDAIDHGVARDLALGTVGRLDDLHRDLAFVVVIGATLLVLRLLARRSTLISWGYVVLALAVLQIALGVFMAYSSLMPAAQVGHLTIASLLLGAETVLWLKTREQRV
jgi:cytochrome c oxidase assembly protein subunit 15